MGKHVVAQTHLFFRLPLTIKGTDYAAAKPEHYGLKI